MCGRGASRAVFGSPTYFVIFGSDPRPIAPMQSIRPLKDHNHTYQLTTLSHGVFQEIYLAYLWYKPDVSRLNAVAMRGECDYGFICWQYHTTGDPSCGFYVYPDDNPTLRIRRTAIRSTYEESSAWIWVFCDTTYQSSIISVALCTYRDLSFHWVERNDSSVSNFFVDQGPLGSTSNSNHLVTLLYC